MSVTADSPPARAIAELVERSRFEVLPLDGVEEQVLEHVPRDVTLTVTVSPTKGLEPSFDLVARLAGHGYGVVPHLSARLVESRSHLGELVARLAGLGIRDVFVVAGDATEAAGPFEGAAGLLDAMAEIGHPFEAIGIAGYPEPHPFIDEATAAAALAAKRRHATYLASQVCFDPAVIARWVDDLWAAGTRLPVYVGVPGAVSRAKLLRVSTRIGIGDSLRFLRKQGSFVSRFLHGGFSPDPLVDGLAPLLADPERKLAGLHVFTFNDVADTEAWRQHRLRAGGHA